MGTPGEPKPVKLFVALLACAEDLLPAVESDLEALFGPIESTSMLIPWSVTRYYEREMGGGLLRRFLSFGPLISSDAISEIKRKTQTVEQRYARAGPDGIRRRVNIDPGYLDAGKAVLASTKSAAHRIYLRSGIYGEVTLLYSGGSFQPLVYTYPDYVWPETAAFLGAARSRYLEQLRQNAAGSF